MTNPWVKISDALLADRVSRGDASAFAAAYDRYSGMVLRHLIYRSPSQEIAEDLLSKTFLKAWEYVRSGKKIKYLKQFLYTTANNNLTDYYRSKGSTEVLSDDLTEYDRADENIKTPVLIDTGLDRAMLEQALAKVKPEFRDILVMRYFDELEINEVAKILNLSPNAVYVRAHRALRALKNVLTEKQHAQFRENN